MIPLRALAPFVAPAPAEPPRCELCATPLGERHRHVVEVGARGVLCACRPCALLFDDAGASARFRSVPDRVLADPSCALSPARLGLPVSLACCVRDSARAAIVVHLPGPAGVVEGALGPGGWGAIRAATPLADQLADDVETLVLHGTAGGPLGCTLAPVTVVFELAARMRAARRGLSAGPEVLREVGELLAALERGGEACR